MLPNEYIKYLNASIVKQVANRAGTNSAWLYQIGRGQGCSAKMAVALEESSKHYSKRGFDFMTAEEILDLDGLRKKRAQEIAEQYGEPEKTAE